MYFYFFIIIIVIIFLFIEYGGNNKIQKQLKHYNEYIMALESGKNELVLEIEKNKNTAMNIQKDLDIIGSHYIHDCVKLIAVHNSSDFNEAEKKLETLFAFCEKHGFNVSLEQKYKFKNDLKHEFNRDNPSAG